MTHENKKIDDFNLDKMMLSRSIPKVPEDVKARTMAAFKVANAEAVATMAEEKREFSIIIGVFITIMALFGVVVALNMHLFTIIYQFMGEIVEKLSLGKSFDSALSIAKYVIIAAALVPAILIARKENHKTHK